MSDRAIVPASDQWIAISGEIGRGDATPHELAWALAERRGPVFLRSAGGDWADGLAMHQQLSAAGRDVHAQFAGSAAIMILLAGRRRTLAVDGWLLVHSTWTMVAGQARRLREHLDYLERHDAATAELIAARTTAPRGQVERWLQTETLLSAAEALRWGFVHDLTPAAGQPEPTPRPEALEVLRRQIAGARRRVRRSPAEVAATAAALVDYRDAPGFEAVITTRPPPDPDTIRTRAATLELAEWTARAVAAHEHGRPLPTKPWPGRWPCLDCGRLNYQPPTGADGRPAACVFCNPPSPMEPKT